MGGGGGVILGVFFRGILGCPFWGPFGGWAGLVLGFSCGGICMSGDIGHFLSLF